MLRRTAKALPHGRRSLAPDDDGRSRGRAARGARRSHASDRSRLRSRASAARSSFRSRRRRPSRSGVSAPTSCTGRASSSRCPSGARRSTRSTSSRIQTGIATLDLRVSSGTYVRSIADALGGHCVSLRRTEVGPFSVEEADAERVLSLDEALGRIGLTVAEAEAERQRRRSRPAGARGAEGARGGARGARGARGGDRRRGRPGGCRGEGRGRRMRIAHAPGAARAPAAGRRDRHLRRRSPRAPERDPGGGRLGARADRDHVRSASARGARQRGRADHDARAPAGAVRRRWASSRRSWRRSRPS